MRRPRLLRVFPNISFVCFSHLYKNKLRASIADAGWAGLGGGASPIWGPADLR